MVRTLIKVALAIAGNAIGLVVAAWLLDDMSLDAAGFIVAVLIFTVAEVVLQPLIRKIAVKNAEALQGGTALVTTFLALLITELVADGLEIEGAVTWLLATLIVWLITMLAGVILVKIFLKDVAEERR